MSNPFNFIQRLELKDRITIIFSVVALTMSAFTLYKQYHQSIDLLIYTNNFGAKPNGNLVYYPFIDLGIVNKGNTPAIVTSVSNYFVDVGQGCNLKPSTNWFGVLSDDKYFLPTTYSVMPGGVTVRRFYFDAYTVKFPKGIWVVSKTPCIEVGTIGVDNQETWKTLTLGTVWFGASDPNEHPKAIEQIKFITSP